MADSNEGTALEQAHARIAELERALAAECSAHHVTRALWCDAVRLASSAGVASAAAVDARLARLDADVRLIVSGLEARLELGDRDRASLEASIGELEAKCAELDVRIGMELPSRQELEGRIRHAADQLEQLATVGRVLPRLAELEAQLGDYIGSCMQLVQDALADHKTGVPGLRSALGGLEVRAERIEARLAELEAWRGVEVAPALLRLADLERKLGDLEARTEGGS